MEEGIPSTTAIASAMVRAAHLLWDDEPKIFEDPLALKLCGAQSESGLRAQFDRIEAQFAPIAGPGYTTMMRRFSVPIVVMRSRYLEDEVDHAVERGVSQYAILGAGLDSFAYRRTDLANSLRVFEVDHPATQAWKRARLQQIRITLPSNLVLVPVDFEKQSLIERLQKNDYHVDQPGLFSWLGVTPYLTLEAIFGTLRSVASLAPGTEIIFEYMIPKESADEESRRFLEATMAAAAGMEPLQSFFEPAKLAEDVRKLGFSDVSDFGPHEAEARYFAGRTDGLRPPALNHYMRARVGTRST